MTHQTTSLRPFLTEFIHFDRRATLIALLMNLAGAMVEGLGIVLLLPLLTLAGVFSGSGAPPLPLTLHPALTQWLEHTPQEHKLLLMLSLFVSLIALQSGISLRREQLTHRLQLRFVDHLRIALFGALAQARWRFLAQHHSSEFLSVLTTDISRVGVGALFLLQLFTQFALFSAYLIVAFGLSPQITGLALLTGAGLWWVLRSTRDIAKQGGVLLSRTNQHLFNEIQEFLGALKLIKIHDETAGYQQQFRHVIERLRQQQLAFSQVRAQTQSAFRIGSALALAVLTYAALTWARACRPPNCWC